MPGFSLSRSHNGKKRNGGGRRKTYQRMASAGRGRAFQRPGTGGRSILAIAVGLFLFTGLILSLGIAVAGYSYVNSKLPSTDLMAERQSFQSTFIYDRNGELLYEVLDPNGGRRLVVPIEDMSQNIIDATLGTEDPTFYENPGVDAAAVIRALYQNVSSQSIASGFSTITMQLVRNVLFTAEERFERSLTRKVKETVLAYQLSQRFTKDEILEMYLNEIPYGNLYYGIEAAAQGYFGKSAKDLTLGEASLLAGLPQSPTQYSPYHYPEEAKERQEQVLALMVKHGYITQEQADAAAAEKLTYQEPKFDIKAPHFTLYVRDLLVKRFGEEAVYRRGLRVYTTLDLAMLKTAEEVARSHIDTIKELNANNSAIVAIDPRTAEVLVMMGSVDYYDDSIDGSVNMAVADRQPGSALKPFAYAAAFEKGLMTPDTLIDDKPTTFPGLPGSPPYAPRNHDLRFRGPVSARNSLAGSLNVPAVLTLQKVGIANFIDTLHNCGITGLTRSPSTYGLSIVLGGAEVNLLDVTYAYTVFANNGMQIGERVPLQERKPGSSSREYEPVLITRVTDAEGRVLYDYKPNQGKRVLKNGTAWFITSILSDDKAREGTYGAHSFLELSRPAAAKTGTTEFYQDGWTVGYTPDLVVGVWVGNADYSLMKDVYGVSGAGYIWHNFMEAVGKNRPVVHFTPPANVHKVKVCAETNLQPTHYCPTRELELPDDMVPNKQCTVHAAPKTPTPGPTPRTGINLPIPIGTPKAGNQVVVPDVVGMAEAQARQTIEAHGLNTTYTNWQSEADVANKSFFHSVAVGAILSQQPAPGSVVPPGTTVYLAGRKD